MASPAIIESKPRSVNPASGDILEEYKFQSDLEVSNFLDRAIKVQKKWRASGLTERSAVLRRVANSLRSNKEALARDITLEMGKPVTEAEAEVEKCAWNCDYVAEKGPQWLSDEPAQTNASESYVSFLPLGTILAIMPWNFPLWQVFRFSAPALMAGNAILLKHAPNVMRCALNITKIFHEGGLPEGVFQNLIVPVEKIARIIVDARVAAATVTGSPRAGAAVAAQAGAALKKTVLELGGSDAFIVLPDADLDMAVAAALRGRFSNCGQVCLAPKRFVLVKGIAEVFEEKLAAGVAQLCVGDPLERATQLGPMARADLRNELDRQVQDSLRAGARVVAGGRRREGKGYFYEPTVLADLTPAMPVVREETFGPVAALIRADSAEDALELTNSSEYGLSSNIWTQDVARAREYARRIDAGGVFINGVTASDPRVPVGGTKRSGYGRELASFGIREFVNIQTVWIGPPRGATPADDTTE